MELRDVGDDGRPPARPALGVRRRRPGRDEPAPPRRGRSACRAAARGGRGRPAPPGRRPRPRGRRRRRRARPTARRRPACRPPPRRGTARAGRGRRASQAPASSSASAVGQAVEAERRRRSHQHPVVTVRGRERRAGSESWSRGSISHGRLAGQVQRPALEPRRATAEAERRDELRRPEVLMDVGGHAGSVGKRRREAPPAAGGRRPAPSEPGATGARRASSGVLGRVDPCGESIH